MSQSNRGGYSPREVERAGQIEFSANVSAGDRKEQVREVPFDGEVVELFYAMSAEANNKVGVQVYNDRTGDIEFPMDRESDFINLAGVAHPFVLNFDVAEGQDLTVAYENRDDEPHYANIVATVVQPNEEV